MAKRPRRASVVRARTRAALRLQLAAAAVLSRLVLGVKDNLVLKVVKVVGVLLLLQRVGRNGLKGLLHVDRVLGARLKVRDAALALAPRLCALLRDLWREGGTYTGRSRAGL